MTRTKLRKLSELEGVCLGVVHRRQPCTAYELRGRLREAPSSHWRASAGSVYPLLARLEKEGLVQSTIDNDDGRGRKLIRLTSAGRKALRAWMLAGSDPDLISSVTDPVRSRTFFLDVLSATKRLEYLDGLISKMQHYLAATNEYLEIESATGDRYDYLGRLGAVKLTEARLCWLREVREQLSHSKPG